MHRTKHPSLSLVAFASVALLGGVPLGADECTSPPNGALTLSQSRDDVYPAKWCNPSIGPELWNGLHLDTDNWDEGYGLVESNGNYEATCNPNHFLTRLLNAAWIVRDVQNYAVPFGLHRQVSGLNGGYALFDMGGWWSFASSVEPDEWEPECETNSNATNHSGIDDYIGLKIPGAYNKTALYRSAIVVHEPTHEDVSHIDDDACSNGASCDDAYGHYNANTMHVNYLYDAAGAYVTELYNGTTVRPVASNSGQCGFIPRFSANERAEALNKSENDLDSRFEQALPPGLTRFSSVADLDEANGTPFACQQCGLGQFTFDPNFCQQTKACNEILNPANAGVNLLNRIACSVYNSKVGDEFVTPAAVAAAKADMQSDLHACASPSYAAARAYCESEKAGAATASQIDSCGWLDQYHGPDLDGQLGCVQEYCQEKWNESGGWAANQDPYGCGSYLCGGESCGSAGDEAACKEQVVVMHADPELYVPQCQSDGCKGTLAACLVALHLKNPAEWSYGEPIPAQCELSFQICEMAHKLAGMVWMEYQPFLDPGPLRESVPDIHSTQPAKHWDAYVKAFRDAVARGESSQELGRLARQMTSTPEMVVALYNAAPGEFVGLFGKEGFAELLGPGIGRVAPKAIDPAKLSRQGQEALAELQRLLATVPEGKIKGAIGTISLQP